MTNDQMTILTKNDFESAECRVLSAECRVQSAECRVQSAECRVQSVASDNFQFSLQRYT